MLGFWPRLTGDPVPALLRPGGQGFGWLRMCRLAYTSQRSLLLVCILTALMLAAGAALPGPAWASRGAQVIRDCLAHDRITHSYTVQDYRDALRQLPTDVREYSDCGDVIRRAELAAAGGGSQSSQAASGGLTGTTSQANPLAGASPHERAALDAARRAGARAVRVGGLLVRPGASPVRTASIVNSLPTPLLAGIIALLVSALLGPAAWVRNLVRARRSR